MKSKSFLTLHSQQRNYHVQGQKGSIDIKILSGSTVILLSYENTFCAQRKQKYDFIQQFLLFPVSGLL